MCRGRRPIFFARRRRAAPLASSVATTTVVPSLVVGAGPLRRRAALRPPPPPGGPAWTCRRRGVAFGNTCAPACSISSSRFRSAASVVLTHRDYREGVLGGPISPKEWDLRGGSPLLGGSGKSAAMSPIMLTSSVFEGTTILAFAESARSTVISLLKSCALPTKYLSAASLTS